MSVGPKTSMAMENALPVNWTLVVINNDEMPQVGRTYRSLRTGRRFRVTAVKGNTVYYAMEDFDTLSTLFLPLDKFCHLVGIDLKDPPADDQLKARS